ncbi:MAG: twin-arginine translocase TatA/TatE family subunit [Hyphomicrobiales bacterium]|jgi:sec-independent protein translocase protein TatA|nr:twin-arginine translocase TatA/TatE family subunit [Hyphomicrobiales bacterium]|tara:strand:+ start:1905 stop:2084 length:180 start_codon:yes stop_codon:yes gene_type:complete
MGISGVWQWVIIALIVLLLFSRPGKISKLLGDLGIGMRNFRDGLKGEKKDIEDDVSDKE